MIQPEFTSKPDTIEGEWRQSIGGKTKFQRTWAFSTVYAGSDWLLPLSNGRKSWMLVQEPGEGSPVKWDADTFIDWLLRKL
jgi:hypothetical protein